MRFARGGGNPGKSGSAAPSVAEFTRARRRRLGTMRIRAFCSGVALSFRRPLTVLRTITLAACALVATHAPGFDLEGHRGTRGLAPENTLAAFRRALQIGVNTIETDMAVTRDGIIVISHETFLNPDLVRNGDGRWLVAPGPPIHSLTLEELRRYDVGRTDPASKYGRQFPEQRAADGERFPQLTELLDLVKASGKPVRLNIETKITPTSGADTPNPIEFASLVVAAVRAANMSERVTVQSFDWRTLIEVKRQAPDIETSCLTIQAATMDTVKATAGDASPWHAGLALRDYGGSLPALVKAARCGTWSMFWRDLDAQNLAAAHALGLKVLPWTVNDRADMSRLIDLGVDGIITDYPDRLREVMAGKKMALP
jgi:glycerophosphoryl diester phosphodiesterase